MPGSRVHVALWRSQTSGRLSAPGAAAIRSSHVQEGGARRARPQKCPARMRALRRPGRPPPLVHLPWATQPHLPAACCLPPEPG